MFGPLMNTVLTGEEMEQSFSAVIRGYISHSSWKTETVFCLETHLRHWIAPSEMYFLKHSEDGFLQLNVPNSAQGGI